jgi:hypothetical protein
LEIIVSWEAGRPFKYETHLVSKRGGSSKGSGASDGGRGAGREGLRGPAAKRPKAPVAYYQLPALWFCIAVDT